jgi:two-component system, sensor histidine kinase and response regulator
MEGQTDKIFDFETSIRRYDGDRDLYRDLIRFFLEDSPALLRQLHEALAAGDDKSAVLAAHTLKGLAANFHGLRAVDAADQAERAAARGGLSPSTEAVLRLEQEIAVLQQALRDFQAALASP